MWSDLSQGWAARLYGRVLCAGSVSLLSCTPFGLASTLFAENPNVASFGVHAQQEEGSKQEAG